MLGILAGKSKSGRTQLCQRILEAMEASPYHCYTGLLNCALLKGKKVRASVCVCVFLVAKQLSHELEKKVCHAHWNWP